MMDRLTVGRIEQLTEKPSVKINAPRFVRDGEREIVRKIWQILGDVASRYGGDGAVKEIGERVRREIGMG